MVVIAKSIRIAHRWLCLVLLIEELLPPVACALEVEEEVQDAALKRAPEAVLTRVVPLLVHDAEGDVLVGRARLHDTQIYSK